MEREEILQQISSSKWYNDEAARLLAEYQSCNTMYGQCRLIPKLEAMMGKIRFQQGELKPYLLDENV